MGPFVYGAHWSSGHTNAAGAPSQSKSGGDCASAELSLISKLISCSQFHISCRISQGGAAGSPERCRSTKETVSHSRLQTTPAPGTQIHELQPGASRKPCRKQRNWFNWDSCRQVCQLWLVLLFHTERWSRKVINGLGPGRLSLGTASATSPLGFKKNLETCVLRTSPAEKICLLRARTLKKQLQSMDKC